MKLYFKGFSREPAVETGKFLLSLADPSASQLCPDFSDILVVLPVKSAIRKVSEAVMTQTEKIFPPDFRTAGSLLHSDDEEDGGTFPAALIPEQLLLWKKVISGLDRDKVTHIIPETFEIQNDTQLLHLAKEFTRLRKELSDQMLSIADVAAAPIHNADQERWEEMADMESRFCSELAKANLADPLDVLRAAVNDVEPFRKYRHIIFAALPDMPRPVRQLLKNLSALSTVQIHILIFAPEDHQSYFDECGCVIPEMWADYYLNFGEPAEHLYVARDPEQMAQLARELACTGSTFDPATTAVAVSSPDPVPWLRREFTSYFPDLNTYDPSGISMDRLRFSPLFRLFQDLIKGPAAGADAVRAMFHHTDLLRFLAEGNGQDNLLALLDNYFADRLPETIREDSPLAPAPLARAFSKLLAIRHDLKESGNVIATLRSILKQIYPAQITPPPRFGIAFTEEEELLRSAMSKIENSALFSGLSAEQTLEILLETWNRNTLYPAHGDDVMEFTGFLDLPFRAGMERLILCGMNEGMIPEILPVNPFLSDSKRGKLGMPNNASRFARDCFYLASLLAVYPDSRFISCRTGQDGKPCRFPRVYFTGTGETELLKRVKHLYQDLPAEELPEQTAESAPLHIAPDLSKIFLGEDGITTLSVTNFKALLENPVQAVFSLAYKMEELDITRSELDPMSLGTLCHNALEHFDSQKDEPELLVELFQKSIQKKCGLPLPLPVKIQMEMFSRRLSKAAPLLKKEDADKGYIFKEWNLNGGAGIMFREDVRIKGKIDRIEISKDGSEIRLIDFKTSDSGDSPAKAHWQPVNKRFINLQLPLYQILLQMDETFIAEYKKHFPHNDFAEVRWLLGYFLLPKAISETGYSLWKDSKKPYPIIPLSEQQLNIAMTQINEVIDLVKELRNGNAELEVQSCKNFSDPYKALVLPGHEVTVKTVKWLRAQGGK